jgi:hypothetical protein
MLVRRASDGSPDNSIPSAKVVGKSTSTFRAGIAASDPSGRETPPGLFAPFFIGGFCYFNSRYTAL